MLKLKCTLLSPGPVTDASVHQGCTLTETLIKTNTMCWKNCIIQKVLHKHEHGNALKTRNITHLDITDWPCVQMELMLLRAKEPS